MSQILKASATSRQHAVKWKSLLRIPTHTVNILQALFILKIGLLHTYCSYSVITKDSSRLSWRCHNRIACARAARSPSRTVERSENLGVQVLKLKSFVQKFPQVEAKQNIPGAE